jgi:hypothetical protein
MQLLNRAAKDPKTMSEQEFQQRIQRVIAQYGHMSPKIMGRIEQIKQMRQKRLRIVKPPSKMIGCKRLGVKAAPGTLCDPATKQILPMQFQPRGVRQQMVPIKPQKINKRNPQYLANLRNAFGAAQIAPNFESRMQRLEAKYRGNPEALQKLKRARQLHAQRLAKMKSKPMQQAAEQSKRRMLVAKRAQDQQKQQQKMVTRANIARKKQALATAVVQSAVLKKAQQRRAVVQQSPPKKLGGGGLMKPRPIAIGMRGGPGQQRPRKAPPGVHPISMKRR